MIRPMMTKRMMIASLAASIVLAAAFAVSAHNPQPREGGRIAMAGDHHVELVTRGATVDAYLLGHDDKPIPAAGHKGLALLDVGGKTERIVLAPADGNRLSGTATMPVPANAKGVVQITSPKGKVASARFN